VVALLSIPCFCQRGSENVSLDLSLLPVKLADDSRFDADHLVVLFVAEVGQALCGTIDTKS